MSAQLVGRLPLEADTSSETNLLEVSEADLHFEGRPSTVSRQMLLKTLPSLAVGK